VDQERAQVGVAPLRDAEQPRLAARCRLLWHQPQPGGKVARPAEGLGRADRGDERRCVEGAEAGDRREAAGRLVFPGPRHELGAERGNALIQLAPFQAHVLDQKASAGAQRRQRHGILCEHQLEVLLKTTTPLGNHNAALQEHSTELGD
jgi:hypothetical protein